MKSGSQIAEFILNYLKELDGLNMYAPGGRIPTARWAAPVGATVKINFDAASVFAAEAVACLQALDLGIHLGLSEVEVEGDSQTVIYKLQEEHEDRSEIVTFIRDSKQRSLNFNLCFSFHT